MIAEKVWIPLSEENNISDCGWWDETQRNDSDVEYIRYEIYRKREKELTDQIKYLIAENNLTDKG